MSALIHRFSGPLPPDRFNIARYCLAGAAERSPDKPALEVVRDPARAGNREIWTYAELQAAVLCLAGGLRADGLGAGARIVIRLDNTSDYAILFFGALAAGMGSLIHPMELI